jgi:hypothetical protein
VPDDPFELRRRGVHRVRVVTAWVAAGAAAGTGAVAVAVSSTGTAQAGGTTTVQNPGSDTGSDSGGVPQDPFGGGSSQNPAQPPGSGGFGHTHASSGGS